MNIFNSLGSNYDLRFVVEALTSDYNVNYSSRLKSYLENRYQGQAVMVYKGREALELALKLLNLPSSSRVAINSFTCYAVYKAIVNAGYKPEYLDISKRDLNFSSGILKTGLRKNPGIKVVIVQNTLGYPCDIEEIAKICKENKIFLIEDLAHSVGTTYKGGQKAGKVGDFTVFSFSQDKMIDGVSGGALVIRNKHYAYKESFVESGQVTSKQQFIDHLYPILTYTIRTTYQMGVGKLIHEVVKKAGLLSNPMGNQKIDKIHHLPNWYCKLIYQRFNGLQGNLNHRREIALLYAKKINPKVLLESVVDVENVSDSTNLRFPIFVDDRINLIKYLKRYGIYVSDIWYDAPIAPKRYVQVTDYKNQCPEAEKISAQILNLPTHQNISKKQAEEIAERVNQWLKLQ